ncbi:MAG: hypothetical protein QXJ59_06690 [Thermofilaceae archaeon]
MRTTIWVSVEVAERLKKMKDELGVRSYDDVLRSLLNRAPRQQDTVLIDVLESVAMLRDLAETDPGAVIVFIEKKLSPLIAQVYNYAKAKLMAGGGSPE